MDIHDLLDSFIDRVSPRPARFLTRMWGDQQKAITYHELRDAILDGSLSLDYLSQWEQDYSVFLTECYGPVVDEAAKAAHEMLAAQYGGYLQDPMRGLMDNYVRDHGGRLIREVSEGQYMAINTLVRQATLTDTLTVDELARCIRPCIGLTQRQAQQCKRFYEQLREDGYSKNAALKKEANLAAKIHRRRAALIAQTEMAYAANEGMDAVIRQNVEQGIISPDVEKEWSTARDERVCPVCGGLHGEKVPENEPFSNGVMLPPAHPGCRCAVKYHLKPAGKSVTEELNWEDKLTKEEKQAVIDYSGSSYSAVNSYMGGEEEYGTDAVKRIAHDLESALSKASLPERMTVYRGTDLREVAGLFGGNPNRYYRFEEIEKLEGLIGKTVTNDRFVSTSYDEVLPQYAQKGVVMHISLPEGAQAADISHISRHKEEEREVLINVGQKMRITSIQANADEEGFVNGLIHLFVEVLR